MLKIKDISLRKKLIAFIVLPLVICTSIIVILSSIKIYNQGITDLKDKSNAILALNILDFTHNHAEGNAIVEMDIEKSLKGLTSNIGSSAQQYKFRISSPNPVDDKHLATKEDLEFISRFKNNNVDEITHIDKENNNLTVLRPVFMDETKGCMECHGNETAKNNYGNLRGVFMVVSDMKPIQKQVNASIFQNSLVGFLILALAIILAIILASSFTKPIIELKNITENLALGDLDHKFTYQSNDEIGFIAIAFNKLIKSLNKTAEFSNEIGKGNFTHDYQILSEKDLIGKSLLNMRDSLVEAQKQELERKEKEKQENWVNLGVAKFGDILRNDSNNIESLAKNFVVNLVNYLDAVQGGLFVINEENEDEITFELTGAIAYDREKAMKKSFTIGESLVGRCAHEKLPIFMTNVPENYVHITSGLGTSNPRCILLIPAILNNKVYAVIELVSFEIFKDYMINFVSSIGEDLASTIANVKINEQTQKLLEETRHQREELAAQEEEMRQNLEELQATQEEMKRKELDLMELNEELTQKLKNS